MTREKLITVLYNLVVHLGKPEPLKKFLPVRSQPRPREESTSSERPSNQDSSSRPSQLHQTTRSAL